MISLMAASCQIRLQYHNNLLEKLRRGILLEPAPHARTGLAWNAKDAFKKKKVSTACQWPRKHGSEQECDFCLPVYGGNYDIISK